MNGVVGLRLARMVPIDGSFGATEGGTVPRIEKQMARNAAIRLTERDLKTLRAIVEQGAAYTTTVRELLAINAGREQIGDRAARAVIARWKKLGLVETHRVFGSDPSVVVPTVACGALTGLATPGTVPSLTTLRHTLLAAAVRPHYARRGLEFTAERLITETGHRPDAIVTHIASGLRGCCEIELSPKANDRLATILTDTTQRFDRVVYWAPEDIGARVLAAAETTLTTAAAGKLRIRPLPQVRP